MIIEHDVFGDVLGFMAIGHPDKIKTTPVGSINPDTEKLCVGLIEEELEELKKAFLAKDPVEGADALADLIYVLIFAAHCYGIPLRMVWKEVQKTNMDKFPGGKVLRRESDGKIMKPEGWKPPDIKGILEAYGYTPPREDTK